MYENRGSKPVLIQSGLSAIYFGKANPKKNENPMMNRLRDELRSTNCRFDIPTAVIMPGNETKHTERLHLEGGKRCVHLDIAESIINYKSICGHKLQKYLNLCMILHSL